jgi:hypothetical protein
MMYNMPIATQCVTGSNTCVSCNHPCTSSRSLCQRPGVDLVRYYDDNIFSKDSNDNGRTLSDMNDNNNDDNGGDDYDGNDGDASKRGEGTSQRIPSNQS